MKKNEINAILVNQTKRRNTVLTLICTIFVVALISLSFCLIYVSKNKKQYISYDETSKIDYKVYLNNNEYFKESYLEENNKYIAGLIDYISANFNYNLSLEANNVEYKYAYRIEADVLVKEKDSDNPLYTETKVLLEEQQKTSIQDKVTINQNIDIDYNYYNNLIKRFITFYSLEDTESTLTINMYVNVLGTCERLEETKGQESVISLIIPLTTKTVGIDISNNLINTQNNLMICKDSNESNILFLIISILLGVIDLIIIIYTIKYEIKTRTAENIYEREMKKILNNYGSYIQTLNNDFDFSDYQLLKVNNFTDMLEIRDTIRQPILMKENTDKTGAYFIIPSNTKMLYIYRLKVSDIKKEIQKNSEEDYKYY